MGGNKGSCSGINLPGNSGNSEGEWLAVIDWDSDSDHIKGLAANTARCTLAVVASWFYIHYLIIICEYS